jgi:surface antigen
MTVRKYGTRNGSVGSVVITAENKNNGHVAYVIGKTNQGWVLAESNYGLNQKVSYNRVIPFNSPSIIGFIKPT